MTITVAPTRNEYTATAGQTLFTYTFKIFENTDLNVYVTPAGQDANDSTDQVTPSIVTGVGDEDGGTITIPATALNDLVTIVSDIPASRTTDYQNNGDFRPVVVNADFDRVVSLAKQVEDVAGRSLVFPESQQNTQQLSLPAPVAGQLLRWNSGLTGLENVGVSTPVETTLNSVAALRALDISNLSSGTAIFLNGYYVDGDGGGGPRRILFKDAAPLTYVDNGGSIIVPDGGDGSAAWIMPTQIEYDPRWFGTSLSNTPTENYMALSNMTGLASPISIVFNQIYEIDQRVEFESVDDISIKGPGGLLKSLTFNTLDAMSFKFCRKVSVDNAYFEGTIDAFTSGPAFGDQGLGFFSCQEISITRNKFKNFGDAAHRIERTSDAAAGTPTDSTDITITGNFYENIEQVSTTTGGSRRVTFSDNVVVNIDGALKFASRAPGSGLLSISNNVVENSNANCFEIIAQDQTNVSDNIAKNIADTFMSYRANVNQETTTVQQLMNVVDNNVDQCKQFCRVSNDYNVGGFNNTNITDNIVVSVGGSTASAVLLIGSQDVKKVKVLDNSFTGFLYGVSNNVTKLTTDDMLIIKNNSFYDISSTVIRLNTASGTMGTMKITGNDCINCLTFIADFSAQAIDNIIIDSNLFLSDESASAFISTVVAAVYFGIYNNIAIVSTTGLLNNVKANNTYFGSNHFENNGVGGNALRLDPASVNTFDMDGNRIIGTYSRNGVVVVKGALDLTI